MNHCCHNCGSNDVKAVSALWEQGRNNIRFFGLALFTTTAEFVKSMRPPTFIDRMIDALFFKDAGRSVRYYRDEFVCMSCGSRAPRSLFMDEDDRERERAKQYRNDNKSASRIATLRDTIEKDPANIHARLELAEEHLRRAEYLEVVDVTAELVALAPGDSRAWMMHGDACLALNNLEDAAAAFSKSADCGNSRNALVSRAIAHARMGQLTQAKADFIAAYRAKAFSWNMSQSEVREAAYALRIAI